MRYVECVLIPDEGGLHPTEQQLADDADVTVKLLHNINLLGDDTIVTLYKLSGDETRVREILDDSSDVITHNTTCAGDDVLAYIHFEPNETVYQLLKVLQEYELVLDTPLVYTTLGGLSVRLIGKQKTIREAIPAVPKNVRIKLEQTGEYVPTADRFFAQLTSRQQDTLVKAVEVGYYDVPRQATHEDIARELDLTGGTVGEHLRKIESKIFTQISP
ncbi:bacterio-opsin activator [halophilic archaeon]|nr:bacterio-opsin activator [halophilic archaeon]